MSTAGPSPAGSQAVALAPYVPATLLRQALDGTLPPPGHARMIEAAALFADFSGFTPMSEKLAGHGRVGAEELTRLLNAVFTPLIALIFAHGGDVAHFSGDALIAYFPRAPRRRRARVVLSALGCGLAMQRVMSESFSVVESLGEHFPLRMKVGVGFGPATTVVVGAREGGLHCEFVLAGPALERAVAAEDRARVGELVCHRTALAPAEKAIAVSEERGDFAAVAAVQAPPRAAAEATAALDCAAHDPATCATLCAALRPYMPAAVYEAITAGQGDESLASIRRVTSLFVDFHGIDYMGAEGGARLQAYFAQTQRTVHRYGGHLNRVIVGDKGSQLHVLFGAPTSYEDHVARALRCVLALQAETPAFLAGQRIGVATGYVFAAPVGSPLRREYTVMGDVVNVSFRLMEACPWGATLVDAATQARDIQARFAFDALAPLRVKGKSAPVEVAVLRAERDVSMQLIARYRVSRGHRPVGRVAELAALARVAEEARAGRPRVIAISGAAGVGKSRLVEEVVQAWLRDAPGAEGFGGDCFAHLVDTPYVPWIQLLRSFFNLQENDGPDERRQKIENLVALLCPQWAEWAGLAGDLLSVAVPESPALRGLDAQQRRARLHELVMDLVVARAAKAPLLLLFEDLHWADGPSIELLDALAARLDGAAGCRLLVCLAFRSQPERVPAALAAPCCRRLELVDLPAEDGAALVRELLGRVEPAGMRERLAAFALRRTQAEERCNPLFIEEFIQSLFDAGLLAHLPDGSGCRITLENADDLEQVEVQVPDTLEGLLLARIDRLSAPNRNVLQVAAVVGREFAFPEVRSAYPQPMPAQEMLQRLDVLDRADFTRLMQREPELAYLFRHALTHEVAYETLPYARRAELHARIGEFLEDEYRDRLEEAYGHLAHHFGHANRPAKALTYALAAGEQAQRLYALKEAARFYEQAGEHLGRLDPAEHWRDRMILALNRADTLRLLGHYDRAEADVRQALALAQAHGERVVEVRALILLALLCQWQHRHAEFAESADESVRLAEAYQLPDQLSLALRWRGEAFRAAGNLARARADFERGVELARRHGDRRALGALLIARARLAFEQNRFDDALASLEQALVLHREAGLRDEVAKSLSNMALMHVYCGRAVDAVAAYRQAIALAREIAATDRLPYLMNGLGEALGYLGEYAEAEEVLCEALEVFERQHDVGGRSYGLLSLGLCQLDRSQVAEARRTLALCRELSQQVEDDGNVIQSSIGLGRCLWLAGERDGAQALWQESLALCDPAGATRWLVPEARVRVAAAWLDAGDPARARAEAERALQSIADEGGCPDWTGLAWLARAGAAERLGEPAGEWYARAVEAARRRSRRIELARCLDAAGRHALAQSDPAARAEGQALCAEAAAHFAAMGVTS